MNRYITTYFDIINSDIIKVILSKILDISDVKSFSNLSYKLEKLINNISTWKFLIKDNLSEYYSVIEDENKFNKLIVDDYLLIYINLMNTKTIMMIYKNKKIVYESLTHNDFTDKSILYLHNIVYRDKISIEFPKFYELIRNYDMKPFTKYGFMYLINNVNYKFKSQWKGLDYKLNNISKDSPDFATDDIINFIKTGQLPINYIYSSEETIIAYNNHYIYVIYMLFLNHNFNIEIQDNENLFYCLMSAFVYDKNMFELILNRISKNKIFSILNTDNDSIQGELYDQQNNIINEDVQYNIRDFILNLYEYINN